MEGSKMDDYPGIDGFLRFAFDTRASLMLDVVFLAMFVVIPVMGASIYLVRYHKRYALHKTIQLILGAVLLVAVTTFELDMRINGWHLRAEPSPYLTIDANGTATGPVYTVLYIHLFFSITTALLWAIVITRALRNFPSPPTPNQHSRWHILWARLAAIDMTLTALTGWIFYWLAFVLTG